MAYFPVLNVLPTARVSGYPCSVGCLNALGSFPNLVLAVTDKTEVTASAALTERLGADEVGVGQVAVVDDVGVTEHRAEAVKDTVTRKDMLV